MRVRLRGGEPVEEISPLPIPGVRAFRMASREGGRQIEVFDEEEDRFLFALPDETPDEIVPEAVAIYWNAFNAGKNKERRARIWRCPNCSRTDSLEVTVTATARLIQHDSGKVETIVRDDDYAWDELSAPMSCLFCQYASPAEGFEVSARKDALLACELLIAAYDRGEERGGHVDWSDVDAAYQAAKAAVPAR